MRTTIDFKLDEVLYAMNEKIQLIKAKLSQEDFEKFQNGQFNQAKVYQSIVKNIG